MVKEVSNDKILNAFAHPDARIQNDMLRYVYGHYYPAIRLFIKQNKGTDDDAADVFQDALLILYQKSRDDQFRLGCSVKTYLYSICKNIWYYRLRSDNHEVAIEKGLNLSNGEVSILQKMIKQEYNQSLLNLMNQLGGRFREVLTLVYFDRLKMEEVAQRMGLGSAQAARNLKMRSMKKLRALMDKSNSINK